MRALTNIGSSPTGRCSGLDKVPWRDLTLLDKLRYPSLGLSSFIIHRVAVSYLLSSSFFDATTDKKHFSFSSH